MFLFYSEILISNNFKLKNEKHIRFMIDCMNPKTPINDVHYYNQMIRGEIYFLIDNLMSNNKTYDEEILKNIIEFFEYYIAFTNKYLECILLQMKEV